MRLARASGRARHVGTALGHGELVRATLVTRPPRFLAIGHVTWDRVQGRDVLGGSVAYAAAAAAKLGWQPAILTAAGPDFDAERDLAGVTCFSHPTVATTRFANVYAEDGEREQWLLARADDILLDPLAEEWRDPDALLICPVAGEVRGALAMAFDAATVGATAQGWLRTFDRDGRVSPRTDADIGPQLAGVHVLFVSENDLPDAASCARNWLRYVPVVALTRGWRGLTLMTREAEHDVPSLPVEEVDPTGAGDVFAAAFLVRYHETGEPLQAAAFAACAASCVVEGVGLSALGDRDEIARRLARRERLVEDGEWDE
jgi:sugar/nucleoside kinase (ribokinase family)